MKTINLRYCYPYYTGDVFVEVSDEVAEVMVQSIRQMYNYDRRTRYHKAFYSLDAFEWTEKYALEHSPSAEEIILMKEEQAAHEKLLPSPFTPYPYGKGSFVALSKQLFKKTKGRKKSPPTKNADRQNSIDNCIKMIRQFILISGIFPGGGRAFFDMSMTVGFCR